MKRAILLGMVWLSACAGQPDTQKKQFAAAPDADREIFEATLARAQRERLDTLPIGEVVARLGTWFVGTPYTPGTLEAPGPEHLVVNLREFDCVTYVENMLALARVIRAGKSSFAEFQDELRRIRYRAGQLEGYPSRLHYFSEWISDNTAKGIVADQTRALGGVADPDPLDFMTRHRESYRQLADSQVFAAIRAREAELNQGTRYMIPEAAIPAMAARIRNGDVIAATSSVKGLDVVHTGLALWQNGKLHLMHAPLVGDSVKISETPLGERILSIPRQDGIMVARPLEPR